MRTIKKRLPVGREGGIVRIRKSLKGDQVNLSKHNLSPPTHPPLPAGEKKMSSS